jgi:uncharacterized protein YbbC (DUF1343 family)
MTVGELAQFFAGEKLIGDGVKVDLQVIMMENWNRNLFCDNFYSTWIKPSPNIPSLHTAIVYPGTCLLEGTNISEGRGTDKPFLKIGAPFVNSTELIKELNNLNIEGVDFEPIIFTPIEMTGVANNPKYKNEICNGIRIIVTDRDKFESVKLGIKLISMLQKLYPNEFKFRDDSFDRLVGDRSIRQKIMNGIPAEAIIQSYQNELNDFKKIRAKYLLY